MTGLAQQLQGRDLESCGEAFDGLEGQVSFAALETAEVGAVDAEVVGEVLLTEAAFGSVRAQMFSDTALQISFHPRDTRRLLLFSLQTYEYHLSDER
ncbi:MAG: hypothetical protein ACRDWT_11435 [Jatrophihabitantaceae bacterium]